MKVLCFEVWKNGKKVALAGLPDRGVLSFILTWVGRVPNASAVCAASSAPIPELSVRMGGLDGNKNVEWLESGENAPALSIGDEFTVRLTASETPDTPIEQTFPIPDRSKYLECMFCAKERETMHRTFLRGGLVATNNFICTRCLVLAEQMLDEKMDRLCHLSRTGKRLCLFCRMKRDVDSASAEDACICNLCVDQVLKESGE